MTPKQTKEKVLAAWLRQTEKYEKGPVVGFEYCVSHQCALCKSLYCERCPLCHDGLICETYKTYSNLRKEVTSVSVKGSWYEIKEITSELTKAMSIRHEFYVRAYNEVLKDAPAERFTSGEGFPELLEIDRELSKEINDE